MMVVGFALIVREATVSIWFLGRTGFGVSPRICRSYAIPNQANGCLGTKERLPAFRNHSCRRTSAGFARAALMACQPTVNRAMPSASAPESAIVHQPTSTR